MVQWQEGKVNLIIRGIPMRAVEQFIASQQNILLFFPDRIRSLLIKNIKKECDSALNESQRLKYLHSMSKRIIMEYIKSDGMLYTDPMDNILKDFNEETDSYFNSPKLYDILPKLEKKEFKCDNLAAHGKGYCPKCTDSEFDYISKSLLPGGKKQFIFNDKCKVVNSIRDVTTKILNHKIGLDKLCSMHGHGFDNVEISDQDFFSAVQKFMLDEKLDNTKKSQIAAMLNIDKTLIKDFSREIFWDRVFLGLKIFAIGLAFIVCSEALSIGILLDVGVALQGCGVIQALVPPISWSAACLFKYENEYRPSSKLLNDFNEVEAIDFRNIPKIQ